jgi:hypothetical protein
MQKYESRGSSVFASPKCDAFGNNNRFVAALIIRCSFTYLQRCTNLKNHFEKDTSKEFSYTNNKSLFENGVVANFLSGSSRMRAGVQRTDGVRFG